MALIVLPWVLTARGSLPPIPPPPLESSVPTGQALPISCDLDGDSRSDSVRLFSSGFDKTIQIKFANLRDGRLSFTARSADRGQLFVYDIDHDGDLDLVWVAQSQQQTAVVWINDGKGDFAAAKDNAPYVSEITALLGTSDPSDQYSLRGSRQGHTLTSSSSSDFGLATASQPAIEATLQGYFLDINRSGQQSALLRYLRKRGPPQILS